MWPEREAPKFGAGEFAPASEDGLVLRVKHGEGGLSEDEGVASITEHANAYEVVCEGWGGVAFGGVFGELWECEISLSGGLLDLSLGGTNTDRGIEWVDVSAQGAFGQVDPNGSAINDGSVKKRKWEI